MALWRNVIGFMTGATWRQPGLQSGLPGAYIGKAATPVTVDTALQLSAVWACARLLTENIAALPVNFYKKNADGSREPAPDFHLARLFAGKMNKWQTRQEYFESINYQLVLGGNNYSAIQRNSKKEIISLVPLMSEQMRVNLQDDGDILYEYQESTGVRVFAQQTIWHNKLFGNGIIGLNPLSFARNSVAIGQAAENSVSKVYENGGKPSGVLTIDKILKKEQRDQIKKNFSELSEGSQNRLFVLEAGMDYTAVSLSPKDIELMQSRRFQIEDLCRFFGVPSVLVNDTQATTAWGSGIQQIIEGFYKLGLRPYLERYEASIMCNLMTPEERTQYEAEFDFNALVQAALSERVKTGKEGTSGGIITPNEWRKQEGLTPIDGGDSLYMQQQMVPIDKLKDMPRSATGAPPQGTQASGPVQPIHNHVHLPEMKIPDINIPAPVINYTPDVAFEVAAPQVHVTNEMAAPVVNVPAPVVNITNEIKDVRITSLPKRKTETKVDYNDRGDIKTTTQTEMDV